METVAVIDFETTGMSPEQGARATEIAAVLVRDGRVVDRYQSLMNTGAYIPPFIESLTGITNDMVSAAPSAARVMAEVARFVGRHPMAAHNASFDRKFWDAELARVDLPPGDDFACTLLLSRRLYPEAPDHKLGTLRRFARLPSAGRAHRALADAEVTAHLLLRIERDLDERFGLAGATHAMLRSLQRVPRAQLAARIAELRAR